MCMGPKTPIFQRVRPRIKMSPARRKIICLHVKPEPCLKHMKINSIGCYLFQYLQKILQIPCNVVSGQDKTRALNKMKDLVRGCKSQFYSRIFFYTTFYRPYDLISEIAYSGKFYCINAGDLFPPGHLRSMPSLSSAQNHSAALVKDICAAAENDGCDNIWKSQGLFLLAQAAPLYLRPLILSGPWDGDEWKI